MYDSAEKASQGFTTVGLRLTAIGGAIDTVYTKALKTGVAYNTLQKTSRAALTTIFRDDEAANRQMDRLDAFARTSPFAKQVFIAAQQQMLGFGIEAGKVIPYLDAIQNSVAAIGGGNQDVAELAEVMAKVQATGKITAITLQEFGRRGIDAATLIGSQMEMTGAQVCQSITAGTLDAGVALDALAAGMQSSFGGAAAGVKETFVGATDRVKAAWRDLASELATPLVDPNGGGALVWLLNWAADVMRAFQSLPEPIKWTVVGMGAPEDSSPR